MREWYHCVDEDYRGRLAKLIGLAEDDIDKSDLRKSERPYTFEVEAALRQACRERPSDYGWEKRLQKLSQARKRQPPLAALLSELREQYWLDRFVAHHLIVPYGSQAIEPLVTLVENTSLSALRQNALWVLRSIGAETTLRLADQADHLMCPDCFVCCSLRQIAFNEKRYAPIPYYGCRACGQSLTFQSRPQEIVAVLDEQMVKRQTGAEDSLRVNWLYHNKLFDFDRVEIIQAGDEAVERFAVRVGNDTDPVRAPGYKSMGCTVACDLSNNTLRILERVFGEVSARP